MALNCTSVLSSTLIQPPPGCQAPLFSLSSPVCCDTDLIPCTISCLLCPLLQQQSINYPHKTNSAPFRGFSQMQPLQHTQSLPNPHGGQTAITLGLLLKNTKIKIKKLTSRIVFLLVNMCDGSLHEQVR